MKIEKFSKIKNGMYKLKLENSSEIIVHEDLILKYELLLSKSIDENTYQNIMKENQVYEIYNCALKYINIRLRSRKELIEYLKKKNYEFSDIESAINILEKQKYLDDNIYAKSFILDKIKMSSYGPNRIKNELEKMGVDNSIILDNIDLYQEETEYEKVNKIIDKQIKSNHNKGTSLLKKKIYSYLISLGYNQSVINDCINNHSFNDESLYKKEYDKLYKKLSKKYKDKELEYMIKQKMYQKGFME